MIKEISVGYTESHPMKGKYSTSTFFASEKYSMEIQTPEQYQEEYGKAFNRVQAMVDAQVEIAATEGSIVEIAQ